MPKPQKGERAPGLVPFKPGQSGNPGGMSKLKKELKQAFRESTEEAHAKMVDIMRGMAPDETMSRLTRVYDKKGRPAFNLDGSPKYKVQTFRVPTNVPVELQLEAARLIAERALGKPVQPVDGDGDGGAIPVSMRVTEIRRVILNAVDQREKVIEHDDNEPVPMPRITRRTADGE